LNNILSILLDT